MAKRAGASIKMVAAFLSRNLLSCVGACAGIYRCDTSLSQRKCPVVVVGFRGLHRNQGTAAERLHGPSLHFTSLHCMVRYASQYVSLCFTICLFLVLGTIRNNSLLLSQAQGIQNDRLCLPSKRTYCSPTYLVGSHLVMSRVLGTPRRLSRYVKLGFSPKERA